MQEIINETATQKFHREVKELKPFLPKDWKTYEKFHSSIILDIEVAMLPKQSKEVLNHLTRLHRKRS